MKTMVIINKLWKFRANWKKLHNQKEYHLILITCKSSYDKIPSEQKDCFTEIICTEDFGLEDLEKQISNTVIKFGVKKDELRIVTTDERLTHLVGQLRDTLKIPGDPAHYLEKFRNKIVMKQALKNSKIKTPKYIPFDPSRIKNDKDKYLQEIIATLGLPIFAKPTDAGGARGVGVINNVVELEEWCNKHLNDKNYELDELIKGDYYHTDSIVKDGKITLTLVCKHPCPNDIALREKKPLGNIVLKNDDPIAIKLQEFTKDVLESMKPFPENCVFDLDLFLPNDGTPVFIEIAARSPGGMMPEMYEKVLSGLNIEETHFRLQMGLPVNLEYKFGFHSAYFWIPRKEGIVQQRLIPDVKSAMELKWHVEINDKTTAAEGMSDIAASILLWNKDYRQLEEDFENISKFEFVKMKEKEFSKETVQSAVKLSIHTSPLPQSQTIPKPLGQSLKTEEDKETHAKP